MNIKNFLNIRQFFQLWLIAYVPAVLIKIDRGIVAQYTIYVALKCSLHIKITQKIPFLKMNTVLCGTVKKILEQQTTKLPLNFSQNRIFECND